MSTLEIRPATPADAEALVAGNLAMAAETEARGLDPAVLRAGVEAVLRDPDRGTFWVATRGGRVVGQMLITLEWSDWRNGWFWWIQSVFVAADERKSGVYRALHEHVERAARARGDVCGLRLYVERENTIAQRVYQRMGMSETHYHLYEIDWSGQPAGTSPALPPVAATPPPERRDAPPELPRAPLEGDIYCLACGYNLRGLSGDLIRCPECGAATSAEALAYPAERIRKYLRLLESHLVAGVVLALLSLPLVYITVTEPQPGAVAALGFLAAIWVAVFFNFRKLCRRTTNWRRGIFRYHVVGCLACIVVIALVSGSVIASDLLLGPVRRWREYRTLAGVATFPLIVIALVLIGRRLHRWLTASMTVMRREVAVSLAKEYFAERGG